MRKFLFALFFYIGIVLLLVAVALYLDDAPSATQSAIPQNDTISLPEDSVEEYEDNSSILPDIEASLPKEKVVEEVEFEERLSALNVKPGNAIFIRIFKKEAVLEVWIKVSGEYTLFKVYPICAYSGDLGPKLKEGDKQSPEGFYKVRKSSLNPKSSYHLSFNLGYPNAYDQVHGRTGSYLMVHGECVSIGCYAMTNGKIEEIYALVKAALEKGQDYVPVHAFPFYMTAENLSEEENNPWYDFWLELKEGYDYFEFQKLPPLIKVQDKQYTIHEANQ